MCGGVPGRPTTSISCPWRICAEGDGYCLGLQWARPCTNMFLCVRLGTRVERTFMSKTLGVLLHWRQIIANIKPSYADCSHFCLNLWKMWPCLWCGWGFLSSFLSYLCAPMGPRGGTGLKHHLAHRKGWQTGRLCHNLQPVSGENESLVFEECVCCDRLWSNTILWFEFT